MNAREGLDPAVAAILSAARDRSVPRDGPIAVDARSLPAAFAAAESDGRVPLVAEVKPTSPTSTHVRTEDPTTMAAAMERAGAAAISVLTEPTHFEGSVDDLAAVRQAVSVPVLRKDFLIEPGHLDAVAADVVLLIVRFLGEDLPTMLAAARDRGFQALVEVHTREELELALEAGADLIGINNRDLTRLAVDLGTFERVATGAPPGTTLIAESGITDPQDVRRMRAAGADGLLVGSAIMAGEVAPRTARLVEAER